MRGAEYEMVEGTPEAVTIRDVGPWTRHRTITNDAEAVVEHMLPILHGRRLFYYDSNGEKGELVIANGKFSHFAAAPKTT